MASSLAAISGVSSHELIVEMRADKKKKNISTFLTGKKEELSQVDVSLSN